jgi:hypothetical protein
VIGVLGLAACSQPAAAPSTRATTSDTASTSTADPAAGDPAGTPDREAFRSCLAENGITLPERGADGDRPAPPDGAGPGAGGTPPSGAPAAPADGTAPQAGDRGTPPAPDGVDADTWAAAQQACTDLVPTPPTLGTG